MARQKQGYNDQAYLEADYRALWDHSHDIRQYVIAEHRMIERQLVDFQVILRRQADDGGCLPTAGRTVEKNTLLPG